MSGRVKGSPIRRALGRAVRSHREALGISQEELGLRADVHRTYVSDIERGSRNPTIEVIHVLTKALECSLEALMADVDQELKKR